MEEAQLVTSPVVMEEENEHVQAATAAFVRNVFDNPHPSLDLTNYNSTTSEYMPTYFDFFDTVSDAPSGDPLSSFMDTSPCSSLLSDDDFSYQLDVDKSLETENDDDDDNNAIFHEAVSYEGDLDVFFDAVDSFDYPTVDATGPFCWAYYTLMWHWMSTLFHRPLYMILFSLPWVNPVLKFLFSAQPFLLASALFWDTLIYYHRPPSFSPTGTQTRKFRRHLKRRPHIPLVGYPRRWVILTMCLGFTGTRGMIHPATTIHNQLYMTVHNTSSLTLMVDFSDPVTFGQYHMVRFKELKTGKSFQTQHDHTIKSSIPKYREPLSPLPPYVDLQSHQRRHTAPLNVPSEQLLHFFDTFSEPGDVDHHSLQVDFFTPHLAPLPTPFNDMAGLSEIMASIHHVSCDALDSDYTPSSLQLPSPAAYNTATGLLGTVDLKPHTPLSPPFSVIFDSGASLAISPCKEDFVGPIQPLPHERRLGGMAAGMLIEGIGTVRWTFKADGKFLVVNSRCYYVPDSKARLISPQRLFNKKQGITGRFVVTEDNASLDFDGFPPLHIDFDSNSHLPTGFAKNHSQLGAPIQANLAILSEENQNLTPAQKLLLEWHFRFGHKSMQAIQRYFRNVPFVGDRFKSAGRCVCPRCATCEFAKGHRQSTKGNTASVNTHTDGSLRSNAMRAGQDISVDHFESRLLGRTLTSFGNSTSAQYKGGCVFVDHMSSYLHVEMQLGFSSSETIRAKQNFEKLALDHGVIVSSYHADNGTFKANAFVSHIREHNQKIQYCGVNAHHKNAVAERSIRTVSECARALLLHAALHWKTGIDSSLWPMAVSYAAYLYNHLPNHRGIAPADLFTGVQIPRHKLKSFHTWGCPVYVLDPQLQQGRKLPRWEPRARRGIFMGYSTVHSSDVPLVLNLHTGHISPQYHVVFDDSFSTVPSLAPDDDPPTFWSAIDFSTDSHRDVVSRIPLDKDSSLQYDADYMTPLELEERTRLDTRNAKIRSTYASASTVSEEPSSEPLPDLAQHVNLPPSEESSTAIQSPAPQPVSSAGPRRSTRSNKGLWSSTRLSEEQATEYVDKVFLSSVLDETMSHTDSLLSYQADLHTDFATGEVQCNDPRAYLAKTKKKKYDADNPSYHDAMTGEHAKEYQKAMCVEIKQLISQNTWTPVDRASIPTTSDGKPCPVLKGTWAFKLKRLPDGSPLKFKARYCVRGDMQKEGIDYFETYAPVVQWSTVRLLLTMILSKNWVTKQVDYTNAFAQATLNEQVYIDSPRGFTRKDKANKVLHLIKSLYGLKQAPKTFFDKLKRGLEQRGFTASTLDPCLFMKHNMIVVC